MITAQLTGGLGNQLFTYARIALLAHERGLKLCLDGSITERVLGVPTDLFEFNLMGERVKTLEDYRSISTQVERILWRTRTTRIWSKRHQDVKLGNTAIEISNIDGWTFRGFYQDFRIARQFIETFTVIPLTLKNESGELKHLTDKLCNSGSIAIHIRRGDYLNYKDSFGVLSDDYYLSAIKVFQERVPVKKVVIFSDSPEMLNTFCAKLDLPFEVVDKKALSTSENLVLMSRFSALITSNSTYSFWAAMLAEHNNVVIPQPWFRSTDDWLCSSDFNNPEWLTQTAEWSER